MSKGATHRFSHDNKLTGWQLRYALGQWSRHSITCHKSKLLVGFTPKAGCSFVAKIFFNNTAGHNLDDFAHWPHPYRIKYQRRHPTRLKNWLEAGMDKIKFVRNPFSRAVSSYFQAMRTQLKDVIEYSLGEQCIDWSFEQYLYWLKTTRLDFTNPHFGPQKFYGEGSIFCFEKVIKIEEVTGEIALSSGRTLEVAPSARRSAHHVQRENTAGYCGNMPYSALQNRAGIFPEWQNFFDDRTVELTTDLYEKDFLTYNYPLSIGD